MVLGPERKHHFAYGREWGVELLVGTEWNGLPNWLQRDEAVIRRPFARSRGEGMGGWLTSGVKSGFAGHLLGWGSVAGGWARVLLGGRWFCFVFALDSISPRWSYSLLSR